MYVLYRSVMSRTLSRRSYSYRGVLPCVGGVYHVCMYVCMYVYMYVCII